MPHCAFCERANANVDAFPAQQPPARDEDAMFARVTKLHSGCLQGCGTCLVLRRLQQAEQRADRAVTWSARWKAVAQRYRAMLAIHRDREPISHAEFSRFVREAKDQRTRAERAEAALAPFARAYWTRTPGRNDRPIMTVWDEQQNEFVLTAADFHRAADALAASQPAAGEGER